MDIKLILSTTEHKELISYCNLNDLLVSEVVKKSFTTGFNIERYGLLGGTSETIEVIKEVPVEKIVEIVKEVKVIEYVDREVIKEVPVERIVTNTEYISDQKQVDELLLKIQQLEERKAEVVEVVKEVVVEKIVGDDSKQKLLEQTLQNLRADNFNKDKRIKELEQIVSDFNNYEKKTGAVYLRGTNLDETLYK